MRVSAGSAALPVAGTVHNTDTLLGYDGFVGVKTGSDDAAGGCFAFRAIRWIQGKRTTITGVVLGQPGDDQIAAGLAAAATMVDRIAGHSERQPRAMPDLRQQSPAPGTAPRLASPRLAGQSGEDVDLPRRWFVHRDDARADQLIAARTRRRRAGRLRR